MEYVKCSKGHFYDRSKGECPMCAKLAEEEKAAMGGGASPTMPGAPAMEDIPVQPYMEAAGGGFGEEIMPTAPAFSQSGGAGLTEMDFDPGFTGGDFVSGGQGAPQNWSNPEWTVDEVGPTHIDAINNVAGFDPIVGWLICIKGPNRGKDYRLHSGTNFIGRSPKMDVCIENDMTISRENAASISYDDRTKTFFVQKGEVRNLIYLNGKAVRMDGDLKLYDRIEIGATELIFVPLCGEQFNWQDI